MQNSEFLDWLAAVEVILPLFFGTQFAPRSPQSLAASFRGAKSSQKFRAAACHRRLFQRRDLLPAPRKALRLRSGEQNLHRNSAPPPVCLPSVLASPLRQSHISPSGHANRAPKIPPGGRPCWRRPAGKAIWHRRATPTGRPGYDGKEKDCRYLSILKSMG